MSNSSSRNADRGVSLLRSQQKGATVATRIPASGAARRSHSSCPSPRQPAPGARSRFTGCLGRKWNTLLKPTARMVSCESLHRLRSELGFTQATANSADPSEPRSKRLCAPGRRSQQSLSRRSIHFRAAFLEKGWASPPGNIPHPQIIKLTTIELGGRGVSCNGSPPPSREHRT